MGVGVRARGRDRGRARVRARARARARAMGPHSIHANMASGIEKKISKRPARVRGTVSVARVSIVIVSIAHSR